MTRWMRPLAVAFTLAATFTGAAGYAADDREWTAGRLLVATEEMPDPRFARTVIFMVEHDADGALGLVVNKPMFEMSFAEFLEAAGIPVDDPEGTLRVHYGGPVQSDVGFVLHPAGPEWENTVSVDGRYAMSSGPDVLAALSQGGGPDHYVFALGYAGWAPGQLEHELDREAWVVVPAERSLIFSDNPDRIWDRAMARWGIEL